MRIFVGSTNPVKINAVINAATETWPEVEVVGFSVFSGVDDQPRSDDETEQGAINRAQAVLEKGLAEEKTVVGSGEVAADAELLGVGLEGGVFEKKLANGATELWSTVWVAVIDQQGNIVTSNGARCKIPQVVADKIQAGQEMGPVMVEITGNSKVRKGEGMIGVITEGFVDRTEEYSAIAKFALGLWYGRSWLQNLNGQKQ